MSAEGKLYVSQLDQGLKALMTFIKNQKIGEQSTERQLRTDREYEFTVCTKIPQQLNQVQAEIKRQLVKVPAGATLYFVGKTDKGKVDARDFMVNDGSGGWRVNTFTYAVRRLEHNVHIRPVQTRGVFNTSIIRGDRNRP